MNIIIDCNNTSLTKERMDFLFHELDKELRKKMRRLPRSCTADLYVVGGACVVATLGSRESTTDIDAIWNIGYEMRECINIVGDNNGLGHGWCNCDFKHTKSYTDAIVCNSSVYKVFDRLVVRMVNLDLLLAMKLVAFRAHKQTDRLDCISIINALIQDGFIAGSESLSGVVTKYFSLDILSDDARKFIGLR